MTLKDGNISRLHTMGIISVCAPAVATPIVFMFGEVFNYTSLSSRHFPFVGCACAKGGDNSYRETLQNGVYEDLDVLSETLALASPGSGEKQCISDSQRCPL